MQNAEYPKTAPIGAHDARIRAKFCYIPASHHQAICEPASRHLRAASGLPTCVPHPLRLPSSHIKATSKRQQGVLIAT